MLALKGKLKRLDGGVPRHVFWEMVLANAVKHRMVITHANVRHAVASVYRVKPEYEAEVAAYVQMLCEPVAITSMAGWSVFLAFDMTPLRSYSTDVREGEDVLAVETNRGWLVYPMNLRRLNWQLTKEKHHD